MGRIKANHNDACISVSDFTSLDYLFSGTALPVRHLDGCVLTMRMGPCTIEALEGHRRGPDKSLAGKFQYQFLVIDKRSILGNWIHLDSAAQCHEMNRAYCYSILAEDPHAFDPPKTT